jgi:hypothetical protein
MKKLNRVFLIGITAMALGTVTTAFAKDDNGKGRMFTVPFFLQTESGGSVSANFTLKNPAILELIYVNCEGPGNAGYVHTDGGPLGLNGTTGTPSTAGVLVIGHENQVELHPTIYLDFVQAPLVFDTYTSKSQTQLGIPVKSKFSLVVDHDGNALSNQITCNGTFEFRSLENE